MASTVLTTLAKQEVAVVSLEPGRDIQPKALSLLLDQLYSWEFNIFEFTRATNGKPLVPLTMALMEDHGLLDGWILNRKTVERYLVAVEDGYRRANPYHNSLHAADVVQGLAVIVRALNAFLGPTAALTKLELFCIFVGGAIHDLGHPGLTNAFLQKARDRYALIYNDRSINESMHVSRAFELALCTEDLDIFAEFFPEDFQAARALMISMVLATDMALHGDLSTQWTAAMQACPDVRQWRGKERTLLLQMTLHLADLANPARPWPLASAWGERIVNESVAQGEEEAARGMAVTPFCDGRLVNLPKAQVGFIGMFAEGTLMAFAAAAPAFVAIAAPCMADTGARWQFLLEAGVRAPNEGNYPLTEEALAAAAAQRELAQAKISERLRQLEAARTEYCAAQQQEQH